MRALSVVPAFVLLAIALVACARAPDATASGSPAPADAPAPAPAEAPAADATPAPEPAPPPPGASAKRAPPQPGELVSPVVAFRADGPDWRLRIENTEGYAHDVELAWQGGKSRATGKLDFQPEPSNGRIVLQGQLDTSDGPSAMVVDIATASCSDAAGTWPQQVKVDVAGMPPLRGCGELAK